MMNKEMNRLRESHKNEIYSIKLENAIEKAVDNSGARTSKAVIALLNKDNISLNENGEITGVLEQLNALKENENTKYLFNNKNEISFRGVNIGCSNNEEKNIEDMNYDELCAYLENN